MHAVQLALAAAFCALLVGSAVGAPIYDANGAVSAAWNHVLWHRGATGNSCEEACEQRGAVCSVTATTALGEELSAPTDHALALSTFGQLLATDLALSLACAPCTAPAAWCTDTATGTSFQRSVMEWSEVPHSWNGGTYPGVAPAICASSDCCSGSCENICINGAAPAGADVCGASDAHYARFCGCECPAGHFRTSDADCMRCPEGTFATAGSVECTQCPPAHPVSAPGSESVNACTAPASSPPSAPPSAPSIFTVTAGTGTCVVYGDDCVKISLIGSDGSKRKNYKIKQSCTVYAAALRRLRVDLWDVGAGDTLTIGGEAVFDTTRRPDGVSTEIGDKSRSIVWSSDKEGRGEGWKLCAEPPPSCACDTLSVLVGGDATWTDAGKYAGDYHVVSGAWRGDQPVYQHDWDDRIESGLYRYFFLSFDGQEWTIAENTEAGAAALARGDYPTFLSNANESYIIGKGTCPEDVPDQSWTYGGTERRFGDITVQCAAPPSPPCCSEVSVLLTGFSANDFAGDYLNRGGDGGQAGREVYYSPRTEKYLYFNPKSANWVINSDLDDYVRIDQFWYYVESDVANNRECPEADPKWWVWSYYYHGSYYYDDGEWYDDRVEVTCQSPPSPPCCNPISVTLKGGAATHQSGAGR